jgi:dCMP deaminase
MIKQRESWDEFFLGLAKYVSTRSKDPSTQTGAVIVAPNNRIVSVGYNGFPASMEDKPEWYANREEKYRRIIHCEENAVKWAREPLNGYTLYTYPFSSCDKCFVRMINEGITRFVAPKPTPDIVSRWGAALDWVRQEAILCGVEHVEVDYEII